MISILFHNLTEWETGFPYIINLLKPPTSLQNFSFAILKRRNIPEKCLPSEHLLSSLFTALFSITFTKEFERAVIGIGLLKLSLRKIPKKLSVLIL